VVEEEEEEEEESRESTRERTAEDWEDIVEDVPLMMVIGGGVSYLFVGCGEVVYYR